jgi:poly-beta-1,6-N-acetyl-D-glucosamine biosynthesis protein PgaD
MANQNDDKKIYFDDEKRRDSSLKKGIAFLASVSLWAIFLYLLQFFLTSLFLAFAAVYLYGQLFTTEAAAGTWALVEFSVVVSVIAFLLLLGWATWNKVLYGGLDRRKPRPMPTELAIENLYQQAPGTMEMAQGQQSLSVRYTADREFTIKPYTHKEMAEEHQDEKK